MCAGMPRSTRSSALYVNLQQVDSFDVGILIIEDRRKCSHGTSTVLSILQQIRIHRRTRNSSFSLMCIVELPGTFAKYTKSAFPSASEYHIPRYRTDQRHARSRSYGACLCSVVKARTRCIFPIRTLCQLVTAHELQANIPVFAPTSKMMPPLFGRMPFLKYTLLSTISS